MITDHAYDSGPVNTGAPCIADVEIGLEGTTGEHKPCGGHEHRHKYSEYVDGMPTERNPGDMHEPKPYIGELDWQDDFLDHEDWNSDPWVHPFVD